MTTLTALRQACESEPRNARAANALGQALVRCSNVREGLMWLKTAVTLAPEIADYHWRFAQARIDAGKIDAEVIESLERAVALDSSKPDPLRALASWYSKQPETAALARELYFRSVAIHPDEPFPYRGFGRTFVAEGGSVAHMLDAVRRVFPGGPDAAMIIALAQTLTRVGRCVDVRECLGALSALDAEAPDALLAAATADAMLGDLERALAAFGRAYARAPFHPAVVESYIECLFRARDPSQARAIYRQHVRQRPPAPGGGPHRREPPEWNGSDALAGRTVFFRMPRPKYGFGDIISFARFGTRMAAMGAEVLVECSPPIRTLIDTMKIRRAVVPCEEPVASQGIDLSCTGMAASLLLDWEWPMTQDIPYFHVPPACVSEWSARLRPPDALHVGVVWRQGHSHGGASPYTQRTLSPVALAALVDVPGAVFHNLQVTPASMGGPDATATVPLNPLSGAMGPFMDSAAATMAVDLVVTIDTAQAHLTGALGKPCLVMLPFYPDWRFADRGIDCGWYPTCRLFRQSQPGNWDDVVQDVRREIARRVAEKRSAHVH